MAKKKDMEYVEKKNVQFVGLNKLDPADQKRIKEIIHDNFIKLERELKQIRGLKLSFKEYEKGGKKKYSVHMLVDTKTQKPIAVNKVYNPVEWDPIGIVHKLMDKARKRIIHKFKTDSSYDKPYEGGAL